MFPEDLLSDQDPDSPPVERRVGQKTIRRLKAVTMDSPAAVPSKWTAPFRKTSTESNEYSPLGGSSTENLAGSSTSLNRHSGGGITQLFSSLAGSNSSLQSDKAEGSDDSRTVSSRVSTDRPIDINIHDIIEETNIEILRDKFEGEGAGMGGRRHHTFSSASSSPNRAEAGHARSASGLEKLKTSQGRKGLGASIMSSFRKRDKSPIRSDRKQSR